jgi:hypothetical protein
MLSVVAQWQSPEPPLAGPLRPPVIVATADYARPVLHGQRVGDGLPHTTIAFLLYAQVPQADGSTFRNILLTHALATPIRNGFFGPVLYARHAFAQADVLTALASLGLPATAPLSVIGAEFFPGGGQFEAGRQQPGSQPDPLGSDLFGRRRILRTSPLAAVEPACCALNQPQVIGA